VEALDFLAVPEKKEAVDGTLDLRAVLEEW